MERVEGDDNNNQIRQKWMIETTGCVTKQLLKINLKLILTEKMRLLFRTNTNTTWPFHQPSTRQNTETSKTENGSIRPRYTHLCTNQTLFNTNTCIK